MNSKNEKLNTKKVVILVIILIAIVIGVICINTFGKVKENKNQKYTSTEEMQEKAPLIDMDNTENAKIERGEKINSSQKMQEEKEVSGLKITNITLHTEKGISYFNATVENTTQESFERKVIKLKFKRGDGSIFKTVEAVLPEIKAGGVAKINASTTQDIVNASDVEIEFMP